MGKKRSIETKLFHFLEKSKSKKLKPRTLINEKRDRGSSSGSLSIFQNYIFIPILFSVEISVFYKFRYIFHKPFNDVTGKIVLGILQRVPCWHVCWLQAMAMNTGILLFGLGFIYVIFIAVPAAILTLHTDWDLISAQYFLFITFSTTGFGDYTLRGVSDFVGVLYLVYLVAGLAALGGLLSSMTEIFSRHSCYCFPKLFIPILYNVTYDYSKRYKQPCKECIFDFAKFLQKFCKILSRNQKKCIILQDNQENQKTGWTQSMKFLPSLRISEMLPFAMNEVSVQLGKGYLAKSLLFQENDAGIARTINKSGTNLDF